MIVTSKGKPENADYFNLSDCCCAGETLAMAIYEKKRDAQSALFVDSRHRIVPCLITLSPKKRKIK